MIRELMVALEGLLGQIRRGSSVNLNDQATKSRAIELATSYFTNARPSLVSVLGGETDMLLAHDALWQTLVRLAQGNNARKSYTRVLSSIRKELNSYHVSLVARPISAINPEDALSAEESALLATLERTVPSAAASYRQALIDLRTPDRFSYRGTASEFREALRETLDHLAPDEDIKAQKDFTLEPGQTKPTMKQKVRFVLAKRDRNKTQREAAEKSAALVSELSGEIARAVYNRASLATHVRESRDEVRKIKRYVDTVLLDLLEISSSAS